MLSNLPEVSACRVRVPFSPGRFSRFYEHQPDGFEAGGRWAPAGKSNWGFIPCGLKLQDKNNRTIKRGGWALFRPHISFLEVRRPPPPHRHRKSPRRAKGEELCQEIFYPDTFSVESILAKRCVCTHGKTLR